MMTTEAETERVVVIQDASRDVNSNAILGALEWFSVKAGDQLIIVAILDWISSPSMFSLLPRKRCKDLDSVTFSFSMFDLIIKKNTEGYVKLDTLKKSHNLNIKPFYLLIVIDIANFFFPL